MSPLPSVHPSGNRGNISCTCAIFSAPFNLELCRAGDLGRRHFKSLLSWVGSTSVVWSEMTSPWYWYDQWVDWSNWDFELVASVALAHDLESRVGHKLILVWHPVRFMACCCPCRQLLSWPHCASGGHRLDLGSQRKFQQIMKIWG